MPSQQVRNCMVENSAPMRVGEVDAQNHFPLRVQEVVDWHGAHVKCGFRPAPVGNSQRDQPKAHTVEHRHNVCILFRLDIDRQHDEALAPELLEHLLNIGKLPTAIRSSGEEKIQQDDFPPVIGKLDWLVGLEIGQLEVRNQLRLAFPDAPNVVERLAG